MKKRIAMTICFLLIFLIIIFMYYKGTIYSIDNNIYNFIIQYRSNFITNIMKILTFFASTKFIIFLILFLILLYIYKYRKSIIFIILIICNTILNNLLKIIIKRDRPTILNLVNENTYSFPSGHTMAAITIYGLIIYLILKSKINKYLKIILISILIILIFLIMVSRIYLGAHFFSDVLGGFCLSISYLLFSITILEKKEIL